MKTEVRDNILDIGVEIIINKGYHNVGIQEILNEANIPKGSFYHYFKSKEDFGTQIVKHYSKKKIEVFESCINDMSKSAKERFISFFSQMKEDFISKEYREGCLIGNCSIELSDNSEVFMAVVAHEFDKWHKLFENAIIKVQESNKIKSDKSATDIAEFVVNSWEGALLRMKSSKSAKPLENFIDFLTTQIL